MFNYDSSTYFMTMQTSQLNNDDRLVFLINNQTYADFAGIFKWLMGFQIISNYNYIIIIIYILLVAFWISNLSPFLKYDYLHDFFLFNLSSYIYAFIN